MRKQVRLLWGILLVMVGLIGLVMPIMPGWVFIIPGLLILADYFPQVHRLVEWAKSKALHFSPKMVSMTNIRIGAVREQNLLVTSEVAIDFMGLEDTRVLGTPYLIAWLEITARNLALEFLESGYDTVGTHVDLAHLAATPIGMNVRLRAEILSVEDRRIRFKIEAWDDHEKIAEGSHERFAVNAARFGMRVQAKAAQLRS